MNKLLLAGCIVAGSLAYGVLPAEKKVRIALTLATFQKQTVKKKTSYHKLPAQKYTLRVALERSNHIYLDDWHIVSEPLSWSRYTGKYKTSLMFYRRFGKNKDIEEKVGTILVGGVLKPFKQFYVLQNHQHALFKDKKGNPLLNVMLGFSGDRQRIAKKQ
ncbi:MAG: hypothetical protein OYH77_05530 [Pseudomonadota bacterium]|nr:hypothetical protein [Pseudomonadota bacterium]